MAMDFGMQKKGAGAGATTASQGFLVISEIKDNLIITVDGGLRAVLAVSSTNFILKSQDEQNAILARYQEFLNSLEFPIQILVQSRKLDIHGYLEKIREKELQQTNELLRVQTEEYVEYIKKLLEFGNIMNKTFFVIVPYYASDPIKQGFGERLKSLFNPSQKIVESEQRFVENAAILNGRLIRMESGIASMGLKSMRLNTQELVELLYNSYNVGIEHGGIDLEQMQVS
jgi:hypothetical protein